MTDVQDGEIVKRREIGRGVVVFGTDELERNPFPRLAAGVERHPGILNRKLAVFVLREKLEIVVAGRRVNVEHTPERVALLLEAVVINDAIFTNDNEREKFLGAFRLEPPVDDLLRLIQRDRRADGAGGLVGDGGNLCALGVVCQNASAALSQDVGQHLAAQLVEADPAAVHVGLHRVNLQRQRHHRVTREHLTEQTLEGAGTDVVENGALEISRIACAVLIALFRGVWFRKILGARGLDDFLTADAVLDEFPARHQIDNLGTNEVNVGRFGFGLGAHVENSTAMSVATRMPAARTRYRTAS